MSTLLKLCTEYVAAVDADDNAPSGSTYTRRASAGQALAQALGGPLGGPLQIPTPQAAQAIADAIRAEAINLTHVHRLRGVRDPCPVCQGLGTRMYSSTATWRGGIGGAAMTYDVCDRCWGTGDSVRVGTNIRSLEMVRSHWEAEQALTYLANVLGVSFTRTVVRVEKLADLAQGQANKRKLPEGEDVFWWNHSWTSLASVLRSLAKRGKKS